MESPKIEVEKELDPIDLEKEFSTAMQILDKFKRTAYFPVTIPNEKTFSDKSKFGGFPYLRDENDWPKCPSCHKHMDLFLQLNLQELPSKKDNGLIQLFYCATYDPLCDDELEGWSPFSKASVCRKIKVEGKSSSIQPIKDEIFDEKLITNWTSKDDYPHTEEYQYLGIDLELHEDVYELMEQRGIGLALEKDKLFGWPHWIQSVEYPLDRKTNKKMELLFQIDSENNLPYMFGDSGIGHLTQSPDNDEELGFGWACC